jgi:tRNA (guanine-N7-)-methyltransferase
MKDAEPETQHRAIRSYVLREGRMTAAQRGAIGRLWGRYGVDPAPGAMLDPVRLFGNQQPTWLEIGFGNGETLAAIAAAHAENNYLGIEVHGPGVGHLLLRLEEQGLENVRVLRRDAVEVLRDQLPPASLAGVLLLFPDPWPKKKHHKRRILQPPFVALVARALRPGGLFHLATDWGDYARQMREVLLASAELASAGDGDGLVSRPEWRPPTRFERRGQRLGHQVWDLVFRRR